MSAYKDNTSGKWFTQFRYTDWTGEVKQKRKRGFDKKREAEQWERDFKEQYDFKDKKKTQQCHDILFKNFVSIYFNDIGIRKTTARTKMSIFNNHVLPYLQKLKMDEITPAHIMRWQQTMLQKGLSPTYLRTVNMQVIALFHHAEKFYGLSDNPCNHISPIGKTRPKEMNFWTLQEYQKVLKLIPDEELRFKLAFEVLFWSGCRISELLALKPDDLYRTNMLRIDEGYSMVDNEDIFDDPKSENSIRTISIPDFVYDKITDYVSRIYGITDNDRIFMFSKTAISQKLNKYAKLAGVKKIRVHDIRHSHVAYLIENNVNIMVISKRLGHSSVKTTWDIYAHLYPDKEINEMSNVIESYRDKYME